MKIAVVGVNGLLGKELETLFLEEGLDVCGITRQTYNFWKGESFDILVNSNGNSSRYLSNQNPNCSFKESVISVVNTLQDFKATKYIYISSSDVYGENSFGKEEDTIKPEKLEAYGLHKYMAELIIRNMHKCHLILRCSSILGKEMKKGPVYDILNNNLLFVSKDTTIQLIMNTEISKIISSLIHRDIKNEIFNVGGIGNLSIEEIGKIMCIPIKTPKEKRKKNHTMDVFKLSNFYKLKTSTEYLIDLLKNRGYKNERMDRSIQSV